MSLKDKMENTFWQKQTNEPLFPDMLWSRPQNRRLAGKLLIIGGNSHSFAAPANAYSAAMRAGAGAIRVILPESLRKTVGRGFAEAEFAASNPSGSLSRQALAQILEAAEWADGVLFAGDLGRNSETAILIESFADKYHRQLTIAQDGLDYFLAKNSPVLRRQNSLLVINLGKLQKLAKNNRLATPVLHSMNLHEVITTLADWTSGVPAGFITKHADSLVVSVGGQVSTTKNDESNWQVELAAYAGVWWLQHSDKPFEALTTAVHEYIKKP